MAISGIFVFYFNLCSLRPPKFTTRTKSLQRNNTQNEQPVDDYQTKNDLDTNGIYGPVKEEFLMQPFKNPETAFKDAMALLNQDEW